MACHRFSARQKNLAAASLVPVGLRIVGPVFAQPTAATLKPASIFQYIIWYDLVYHSFYGIL